MEIKDSLVQACIAQDRKAQKELYLILLPYLRAVAQRYLKNTSYAKDVLQESFVKIFQRLETFETGKGALKSWAAKIVINTSINYNERVIGKSTSELNDDHRSTELEYPALEVSKKKLMSILKQMPQGYFEVFNLFVVDGYSHQEITGILNISEALSRKKLSRARSWLQKSRGKLLID